MNRGPQPTSTGAPADPRLVQLTRVLGRIDMRFRVLEAAKLMPFSAALGLGAASLLAILNRFRPSSPLSPAVLALTALGLLAAALLTTCAYCLLRRHDLMRTAVRADVLLGLDERLSTALDDSARPGAAGSALRTAQLDDALRAAGRVVPRRDMQVAISRRSFAPVAVALAVLALAVWMPSPSLPTANSATQVQAEKSRLEAVQKAIQAQPGAAGDPTLKEVLKELSGLQKDLSRADLSREEALARLSQSESTLQKALDPQAPAERAALDQLAKQLAASSNPGLKQAGEAMQRGETQKAADALKKAGQDAAKMSPEERKAAAESLRQARDSVAALDPETARRLNDAAQAMSGSDPKAAEQAMSNLAEGVQQSSQSVATQRQIEQALSQIQQSKTNIAQSGQQAATQSGTASAGGTALAADGTGLAMLGSPVPASSPVSLSGTQPAGTGTPAHPNGTLVAVGSPAGGKPTGTPVYVPGGQGQGASGQQGQQGGNGAAQGGQSSGQQGSTQPGNGQPSGGEGQGHSEPVYAPSLGVKAGLTVVPLQGQQNASGEQSSTTTNTNANSTGASQVPYEQVYGQYREQAGNALNGSYIPQGYKDLVRSYFDGIAPTEPLQPVPPSQPKQP